MSATLTQSGAAPTATERRRCRVAVVGGGVSGLACALRLRAAGLDVALFEASRAPGGVIASRREGEWLLELGPNSVLLKPEFRALVEEAGLGGELLRTPMRDHPRFVFKRGHGLLEVPTSALAFLRTPLLSLRAKLHLLREPFLHTRPQGEPTVADFARHHLGREMAEMLIAPFISGVYAGDPERMSLPGALPRMHALASINGSLVRGTFVKMWRDRRARRAAGDRGPRQPSSLCSFAEGLSRLPQRLAEILGDAFHAGTAVTRLERMGSAWRVWTRGGGRDTEWLADALVVATPAPVAADLMRESLPDAAAALARVPYTSITVTHLGIPLDSVRVPPRGFGFLVPRGHGLRILGALHSDTVFPGRAPAGHALLTVFIGGATDPGAQHLSDAELLGVIQRDLRAAMGWDGRRVFVRITRWPQALPEYLLGHVALIGAVEAACDAAPAPVAFAGNYLHGISVSDCIRQAAAVADSLAQRLRV